jgi:methylated-DNA-[protein]-cysteine S-methyltransferase
MTRHARVKTSLGEVTLVADGDALTGLYFPHHRYRPDEGAFGGLAAAADDPVLARAARELAEYLAGDRKEFGVPLATRGDEFQERVWTLLRDIPYGQRTTYGRLAEELGDRMLAQQVGAAVGRNPLCVFIPCHRVVGASGSLTGYAGGLQRKRHLLDLEEPGRLF